MYIYHLPYEDTKKLCFILNQNNHWEQLGLEQMQYDVDTIDNIRKKELEGKSASDALLTSWGNLNHTVLELFILLGNMRLYQAMTVLKHFIEVEYHSRIKSNINNFASQLSKASNEILTAYSVGGTLQIPYDELETATDGWKPRNILGRGGYGTVFKGAWKCTQVAIKRLEIKENTSKTQTYQSMIELRWLNTYRHDNILPLYGYSIGGPHPCLVYQYMLGGSLEDRLRTRKYLSWPSRLNIAIGAARGLQFLHTTLYNNKPLIHGDIKSANILLDAMNQPRIGDFGLAQEGPEGHYTHILLTKMYGTRPYLPQDFLLSKQFSTKVDTHCFGVVLFELATALPPINKEKRLLKDHVLKYSDENILELKDPKAGNGKEGDYIFKQLIRVGKLCVQKRAKDRPEMIAVLLELEKVDALNGTSFD